jgi:predicted house-cleaning noncanonical NTP pyrophosphatase (MazG superfamily)
MFPNMVLITHNKRFTYHSGKKDKKPIVYNNKLIRDLKKSLSINSNHQSAILILNQEYKYYQHVIDELVQSNITKIYFFIDDVFRIRHKTDQSVNLMDTHTIEKDFENTIFLELGLIEIILNQTKISDFKIFHCERIPKKLLKKFKYKINYFDVYLNDWVYFKKNENYVQKLPLDYKVTCFNHRRDWQRHLMSALLFDKAGVFLTNSNKYKYSAILKNPYINFNKYKDPFKSNLLDQIKKYDSEPITFVDDDGSIVKQHNLRTNLNGLTQNINSIYNLTERSFVNLVTETRFCTPIQYISEKTLKPMMVNRPFIILGPPHTLALLKHMGFKTFDKWWDESYDDEKKHNIRFAMVYSLIQKILSHDLEDLEKILFEMNDILLHNRRHIKNIPKYFFKKLVI